MSLNIIIPDADFSANKIGTTLLMPRLPALPSGLTHAYLPRESAAKSTFNLVTRQIDASIIGSPTFEADYVTCSQGNCIETPATQTDDWTYCVCAVSPSSGLHLLLGNYRDSGLTNGGYGANLYHNTESGVGYSAIANCGHYTSGLPSNARAAQAVSAQRNLIFGTHGKADKRLRVKVNSTAATTNTYANTYDDRRASARLRIGGAYGGTWGTIPVYFAAIWNRELDESELSTAQAALASWLNELIS